MVTEQNKAEKEKAESIQTQAKMEQKSNEIETRTKEVKDKLS